MIAFRGKQRGQASPGVGNRWSHNRGGCRAIARAFGRGHIVLASDDPDILARDDWPADVHVLRQAVFDHGGFDQSRLFHAHYNRTAAAHTTIRDVALLAKCAASVGTMSSNLSRLVHELQTAALGRAAPFSSMSVHHKTWWVFP